MQYGSGQYRGRCAVASARGMRAKPVTTDLKGEPVGLVCIISNRTSFNVWRTFPVCLLLKKTPLKETGRRGTQCYPEYAKLSGGCTSEAKKISGALQLARHGLRGD